MANLLSGFLGALIACTLNLWFASLKFRKERRALLDGAIAECGYNLSTLSEILEGSLERKGSFKRMSVEYFNTLRNFSVTYTMDSEILKALSRAIIDLEVYNREADYIFDGNAASCTYAGAIASSPISISKNPVLRDISQIMTNARVGVTGSLLALKKVIEEQR